MNRVDRLMAMVVHLQGRRLIRAEDIAEHFEISVRTVYRDIAALGQGIQRACALALEESDRQHRFPSFKVEMEAFDDRSDPKEAVDVANRIVSDPSAVAVIGHFNSGCSIPASVN